MYPRLEPYGEWLVLHGLPIVMWVVGGVLVNRAIIAFGRRSSRRVDAEYLDTERLVRSESAKHRYAIIQVATWCAVAVLYVVVAHGAIRHLGLPITGLVAPATVVGAALGFGAQRIVQDLLAGFFLIAEKQYGFGDVVELSVTGGGIAAGTVEDVTLRVTKLRNADGEVITIPNGQIVKASNQSKDWARAVVDIPLPVAADVGKVNELLHRVGRELQQEPRTARLLLDEPTVMGVESIGLNQFQVRIVVRTLPGKQFDVGRELRNRVVAALANAGISVSGEPTIGADPDRSGADHSGPDRPSLDKTETRPKEAPDA